MTRVANGYDEHSMKATGVKEASSSDVSPLMAVRDKRYTRNGIGWRSQTQEASTLNPGTVGQTPPSIMYPDGSPTGVAARRRGQVDEAKLPWQTAQEATSPQVRPRETLPPWGNGMNEALPPWLKKDGEDEQKEALPPWLKDKGDEEKESLPPWLADKNKKGDEEKESRKPGMAEAADCDDIGGFPDEEDAREALEVLAQFVDGDVVKSIQDAIVGQYGKPQFIPSAADMDGGEDEGDDWEGMGEASVGRKSEAPSLTLVDEAELDAKKRNSLDSSDFALPGRKYPIDTPERARSALARVKQFGSPSDRSKVKAAVKRKYPDMKLDD